MRMPSLAHVLEVVRKEVRQIRRDPRMYPIVLLAPVLQLFLYGYAATFDLRALPVAVHDADRTPESRAIIRAIEASGDFAVALEARSLAEIDRALVRGDAKVGILFQPGFGRHVREGRPTGESGGARGARAVVGLFLDGSDSNTATIARSSMEAIIGEHAASVLIADVRALDAEAAARLDPLRGPSGLPEALDVRSRVFYNPELRSANYMVPAVLVMILMIMTTMLSALSIVKEKEIGTFEMLLATPVRPVELVVGKLAPFVAIGFIDVLIVLATAAFWFEVPIRGSVGLLLGCAGIFVLTTIALGLFVSTLARTQQQAMVIAFGIMLPMLLFSGFIFPLDSMPQPAQLASYALPLRYFVEIVRAIFLRGAGADLLWDEMAALAGMGVVLLAAAIREFRKRL